MMSTITVYINSNLLSVLINIENGSLSYNFNDDVIKEVSLKKTRNTPFEVQIPITALSQFFPKENYATVNLSRFKKVN